MNTTRATILAIVLISIASAISPASAFYVGAGAPTIAENNPEAKAGNIAACFVAVKSTEVGRIVQNTREVC